MSDNSVTKLDQVGYRYLLKQSPDVKLDQVQYRYLVKSSHSVKLDQLQHRYLVKDNTPPPLDYTKTPHQYILDAIKNEMHLHVKERYISFSHPTPDDTVTGFNSTVRMNVTRDSGFKGYATLSYVRPEISDLVANRDIYENFKPRINDIETTHDILEAFNNQFGTKVPVDEIIDSPVDLKQDAVFTASNDSFFWMPGTIVSLGTFGGADRYWDLELGTFTIPAWVEVGIWTQGIDYTYAEIFPMDGPLMYDPEMDGLVSNYFPDGTLSPTSGNALLSGRSIVVNNSNAASIKNRARADKDKVATLTPFGSDSALFLHFDDRRI